MKKLIIIFFIFTNPLFAQTIQPLTNYSFEDLINFVSHRARKGLILPGIFNKADSIEVID
jgi:hypothetical protein